LSVCILLCCLSLADQAALLDARLLDVPMIEFKDKLNDNHRSVKPQSGAWNVRDARLLEGTWTQRT
jgi:hypothetical protein